MANEYKTRTAVYLRKSRSDDESETVDQTLSRHLNILNEYAVKNNITVTGIYKEVVSGDGLFTRPEMIRMLNDIENGSYSAVMCIDIDRLGRSSSKDSGIILETLKDNECKIITPDKVYNLDDDVDEMTVEMKTFFARQELKSIRKRLVRGEIETLKAGGHTGEPPYAYKRKWLGKMPSLEIIPDEAETVKLIYNMYVDEGIGSYLIADKLNELNIPAPDGGAWSRTSVRMILSNPIYTGKIVWNRLKRIKKKRPEDKYKEVANPPHLWIEAQGLHEAIISQEQWDKAQEIRKSRSHPPTNHNGLQNPYSGIAFCKKCGAPLQRQKCNENFTPRLLCTTKGCCPSIKLEVFDERIKKETELILDKIKLAPDRPINKRGSNVKQQLKTASTQLKTVDVQREKLHDLLEQGVYNVETFMKRQNALNDRQKALESKIEKLNSELIELEGRTDISFIIPDIELLIEDWTTMNVQDKNRLLKKIISRIEYSRESRKLNADFTTDISWRF